MKAILIINMPEGCHKCPLHYDYLHCIIAENMYAKLLETISLEEIREGYDYTIGHRPKLCPLKPMPEKNKYDVGKYAIVDYENNITLGHYLNIGYNACIDEIIGEHDEE